MKKILVFAAAVSFMFSIPQLVHSQGNTFKICGNDNLDSSSFIGSTNMSDVIIKSNSLERMRFSANGKIVSREYLYIDDSMRVKGPLFIGDSSLGLYNDVFWGANPTSDHIRTSNGILCFGRKSSISPLLAFSAIKVGIGTFSPQFKLHLHDYMMISNHVPRSVYMAITNSGGIGGGTGEQSSDGFLVGIDGLGNASFRQQENLPMIFYTNSVQDPDERMRIDANGNIGVNNSLPDAKFHLNAGENIKGGLFFSNFTETGSGPTEVIQAVFTQDQPLVEEEVHGVCSIIRGGASRSDFYAVRGEIIGCNSAENQNFGVFGRTSYMAIKNFGGYFESSGGINNFGTYSYTPSTDFLNYAVYAEAPISTNHDDRAGFFNGELWTNTGIISGSDSSIKKNVTSIQNALGIISDLHPCSFYYDQSIYPFIFLPSEKQFGLLAQEVEQVLPDIVSEGVFPEKTDSAGNIIHPGVTLKGLKYEAFIPILIQGVKELDSTLADLQGVQVAASNGLHIDTTSGRKIKLGGCLDESSTIEMKKNLLFLSDNNYAGQICIGSGYNPQSEAFVVNNKSWITSAKFINTTSTSTDNIAASFETNGSQRDNYGAQFSSQGNGNQANYAARFNASGKAKINFGVFSKADGAGTNYAGYFDGPLYATSYLNLPSDSNLKENIFPITNALVILDQLHPKTFNFRQASFPGINLPSGQQYGLVAQDVEPVLPDIVSSTFHPAVYDSSGVLIADSMRTKSLNYEALIPILIAALQETNSKRDSVTSVLSQQIDSLEQVINNFGDRLNELEALIGQCCGDNNKAMNNPKQSMSITLDNRQTVVLNQNAPNPFAENTTITYFIPDNAGHAEMIFSDLNGKIIKTVELSEKGEGLLHVFADNLSSGIYTYSIVVDGMLIETKKMVKGK